MVGLLVAAPTSAQACTAPVGATATCIKYTYNGAQLPTEIIRQGSDGAYQRDLIQYLYSNFGEHPMAEGRWLMSPVAWTRTVDRQGRVVACTRTAWESVYLAPIEAAQGEVPEDPEDPRPYPNPVPDKTKDPYNSVFRPSEMYEGCGVDEILALDLQQYDTVHRVLRTRSASGLITRYYYGTNANPYSNDIKNVELTGTTQQ